MSDLIETWKNDFSAFVNSLNLDRDDYKAMMEYIDEIPAAQPDHNVDISKKVSISCGHENDLVFRGAAIEALARMMPRSYTPDGSHPADEEIFRAQEVIADCIEALEILQPAQPEIIRCKDCKYMIDTGDDLMCDNSKGWVVATTSDFGCVLAERRTDGQG